eukprot:COSAG02_NODE_3956_length_5986_cov_18.502633_2_plen_59_part_00
MIGVDVPAEGQPQPDSQPDSQPQSQSAPRPGGKRKVTKLGKNAWDDYMVAMNATDRLG